MVNGAFPVLSGFNSPIISRLIALIAPTLFRNNLGGSRDKSTPLNSPPSVVQSTSDGTPILLDIPADDTE